MLLSDLRRTGAFATKRCTCMRTRPTPRAKCRAPSLQNPGFHGVGRSRPARGTPAVTEQRAKDFACTVGGVKDDAYVIRDKDGPVDELRVGSRVRTTSALDGSTVSIVTESGSVFRFGQ